MQKHCHKYSHDNKPHYYHIDLNDQAIMLIMVKYNPLSYL